MSSSTTPSNTPISLDSLIKTLSQSGLHPLKAIQAAKVLFPTNPTETSLRKLTGPQLVKLGLDDRDIKRMVLAAWPKLPAAPRGQAQGKGEGKVPVKKKSKRKDGSDYDDDENEDELEDVLLDEQDGANQPAAAASSSTLSAKSPAKGKAKRKRGPPRRDMYEIVDPEDDPHLGTSRGQPVRLDFGEALSDQDVQGKVVIVNRAPVMVAWCAVVCLRMDFDLEESLSMAQVYTDMNATSKAVSLGIKPAGSSKTREDELSEKGNRQPFVDLMGRKIPVLSREDDTWRAISPSGEVVPPTTALRYLHSSFQPALLPFLLRALTLLAASFPPVELAGPKGFDLYARFRPGVGGWGEKGEVKLGDVLRLRTGAPEAKREGFTKGEEKDEEEIKPLKLEDDDIKLKIEVKEEDDKAAVKVEFDDAQDLKPVMKDKRKKEHKPKDVSAGSDDEYWGDEIVLDAAALAALG